MSRLLRFHSWQTVVWSLILVVLTRSHLHAQQPPVDANFDWAKLLGKRSRTLICYSESTPFRGDNGVVFPVPRSSR